MRMAWMLAIVFLLVGGACTTVEAADPAAANLVLAEEPAGALTLAQAKAKLHTTPQPVVIESARACISHHNQPSFSEVFDALRGS